MPYSMLCAVCTLYVCRLHVDLESGVRDLECTYCKYIVFLVWIEMNNIAAQLY
jgi:hypothetical protein